MKAFRGFVTDAGYAAAKWLTVLGVAAGVSLMALHGSDPVPTAIKYPPDPGKAGYVASVAGRSHTLHVTIVRGGKADQWATASDASGRKHVNCYAIVGNTTFGGCLDGYTFES